MSFIFYSPSVNSFYDDLSFYPNHPNDLIKIDYSRYLEIQNELTTIVNAALISDDNGQPIVIVRPPVVIYPEIDPIMEAQNLLDSTDYYVIRQIETGIAIPSDILEARKLAREEIKKKEAENEIVKNNNED